MTNLVRKQKSTLSAYFLRTVISSLHDIPLTVKQLLLTKSEQQIDHGCVI